MTVLGLRRKVEEDPAVPRHVLTVPRHGYRFRR
jgi:DNA-binding response OmpR family regulator